MIELSSDAETFLICSVHLVGMTVWALFQAGKLTGSTVTKGNPMPRAFADVETEFNNVLARLKLLSPFQNQNFESELAGHAKTLGDLSKEMAINPPVPIPPVTQTMIDDLRNEINFTLIEVDLYDPNSVLRDNRKLLYTEAGNWARHFSTVRMTVLTFAITTSVGIMAWRWQEVFAECGSDNLSLISVPVSILWGSGTAVFWAFTYYTFSQIGRQMAKRPQLPAKFDEKFKPRSAPFDYAALVVPVLTGCVWWLVHDKKVTGLEAWANMLCFYTVLGLIMPLAIWLELAKLQPNEDWRKWPAWLKIVVVLVAVGVATLLGFFCVRGLFCFFGEQFSSPMES